jgi:NADH dehydrogenase FAD-containing subunit
LRHLRDWFESHRVRVIEHTRVDDPKTLGADVVVWAGAFRVSDIARNAGLRVNERGQIAVDEHLRSSDPSIFAIGDAAFCDGYRMSCAVALPMGAYVADSLTGATTGPFRFAFVIQCISLGRSDGIVQFVHPDDSPKERALTGRPAAWIKELICRYTTLSLRMGFAA